MNESTLVFQSELHYTWWIYVAFFLLSLPVVAFLMLLTVYGCMYPLGIGQGGGYNNISEERKPFAYTILCWWGVIIPLILIIPSVTLSGDPVWKTVLPIIGVCVGLGTYVIVAKMLEFSVANLTFLRNTTS
jgi:hypothetical protein